MDLRLWLACLAAALAQVNFLLETHELSTWIRELRSFCLVEVIGLGEVSDPNLDKRIPGTKVLHLKDLLDLSVLPGVKSPKVEIFKAQMKRYEIAKDTIAVLYDRKGMQSASMLWWVMSLFGRGDRTAVLNGGLPKWQREGYSMQTGLAPLSSSVQNEALYLYTLDPKKLWTSADIDSVQVNPQPFVQVLDVRARSEFVQLNIKSSINMPIDIIHRADGALRSMIELKSIFEGYGVMTTNVYLTVVVSATGVDASAAILALGVIGKGNCALLDGGWNEYQRWIKTKDMPLLAPPVVVQPVPGSVKAVGRLRPDFQEETTQMLLTLPVVASVDTNCWERCSSFCPDLPCEYRCAQSFCQEVSTSMLGAEVLLGLGIVAGMVLCCVVISFERGKSLVAKWS